jgi:hypothetical protein
MVVVGWPQAAGWGKDDRIKVEMKQVSESVWRRMAGSFDGIDSYIYELIDCIPKG